MKKYGTRGNYENIPNGNNLELGKVIVYIDINNNGIKDDSDVILNQI